MIINHNMASLNTYRQLSTNNAQSSKSLEKLSSGLRINRAGDDAAGLAISEKMRGQIRGLDMASKNAQDAISLLQTAEGALSETHSILQRMRELAVQSASDTNNDNDRGEIQKEIIQLKAEVDRISKDTEFNTKKLLNGNLGGAVDQDNAQTTVLDVAGIAEVSTTGAKAGTYTIAVGTAAGTLTMSFGGVTQTISNADGAQELNFSEFGITIKTNGGYAEDAGIGDVVITSGAATFHIGANKDQNIQLSIADMSTTGLSITGVDVSTQTGANDAITTIQAAIDTVSSERSKLGAYSNRLEHTIANLGTSSENLTAAESRVRDVDMAKEMMNFQKNNILSQAAQAMLAQANQQPQGVLQLLR